LIVFIEFDYANVAQSVEHIHGKDGVASSILAIGSKRGRPDLSGPLALRKRRESGVVPIDRTIGSEINSLVM
jgi:hypothetical protein